MSIEGSAVESTSWPAVPVWALVGSREEYGGDLPLLSLSAQHGVKARIEGEGRSASADTSNYRVVRPGDLVINRLSARDGAYGVSHLAGLVSPAYWVLRRLSRVLDHRWLDYVLRAAPYEAELRRISKFMPPAQFDLPWTQFRRLSVPLPPIMMQRSIADFLDAETARVFALIVKKRRMIDRLTERVWIRRTQLLAAIGERGGWVRLRYAVPQVQVGVVVDPSSYFVDEGIPFIHGSDVREGWIDVAGAKRITAKSNAALAKSQLSEGDVVVVRAGYPGRAAVVPPELAGANCASVLIVRRGALLRPKFLAYFFNSGLARAQIEAHQYGAAQEQINVGHVVDFSVPLPPLDIQDQIVAELDADERRCREISTRLSRQVVLLQERRQALVTAAVTGKLEVPGVAA